MKKLLFLIVFIGLSVFFSDSCSKDYSDCYDCTKRITPKTLDDLYNPRYDTEKACSDDEAHSLENQGFKCEGYKNPDDYVCYKCFRYGTWPVRYDTVCGIEDVNRLTSTGKYNCTLISK